MRGNITRRGKSSWRIKFDLDRDSKTAKRRFHIATVRGTRKEAEAELARLLNDANKGVLVDASNLTVEAYLWRWLDGKHDLSPVTRDQLELRLQLGMGKHDANSLVFCNHDGAPISPNCFSVMWGRAVPQVTFHALRHSHASALIAAGIDVVTVSRRLGHATPTITLNVYAHLFANTDTRCADAIEKVLD
jgi:integrase-like protein